MLVFGGGDNLAPQHMSRLPVPHLVIAADSGVDRARAHGVRIDLAVGDFDSVTAAGLLDAEREGTRIVRHPTAKAETDLELALIEAMATGPERILVVAIDGGRPDHLLANVALLADRRFAGVTIDAFLDGGELSVIHDKRALTGTVGALLSLLPYGGDAEGVYASGLHYPLGGETLSAGSPRGVSNLFAASVAEVSVTRGTLLAIRPWDRAESGALPA